MTFFKFGTLCKQSKIMASYITLCHFWLSWRCYVHLKERHHKGVHLTFQVFQYSDYHTILQHLQCLVVPCGAQK